MNINYEAKYVDVIRDRYDVLYYTDVFPKGIVKNIGIPLNITGDGLYKDEDLKKYILYHAPIFDLKVAESIMKTNPAPVDEKGIDG